MGEIKTLKRETDDALTRRLSRHDSHTRWTLALSGKFQRVQRSEAKESSIRADGWGENKTLYNGGKPDSRWAVS